MECLQGFYNLSHYYDLLDTVRVNNACLHDYNKRHTATANQKSNRVFLDELNRQQWQITQHFRLSIMFSNVCFAVKW